MGNGDCASQPIITFGGECDGGILKLILDHDLRRTVFYIYSRNSAHDPASPEMIALKGKVIFFIIKENSTPKCFPKRF